MKQELVGYIFGYGSLVSASERARHGSGTIPQIAYLNRWRRGWNVAMRNTRLDAAIQRWYEAGVVSGQLVVSHDYVALCEAAFASQGPQSFNEFTTGTDPLPAPVKHVTLVRF